MIDPPNLTTNAHTPFRTPTLRNLANALDTNERLVVPMVAALPNNWSEVNDKGTKVTKRKREQCIWGAHKIRQSPYPSTSNYNSLPPYTHM